MKLSYSAPRDRYRLGQPAPSRFAGLLSGDQRLKCNDDGKQAVGLFPISDSPLGLSLGYSATNFLVPLILAREDAKMRLFVVNDELAHHPVEK